MWSISTNIYILANFLGIDNSIFLKNIGFDCGNTIVGAAHLTNMLNFREPLDN